MRPWILAPLMLAALAAGCGGSEDAASVGEATTEVTGASLPAWAADALQERSGADLGLTMATSDFAPGENRVAFLLVRNDGELVQAPRARVRVAAEGGEPAEAEAVLRPLGPHTHPKPADPHDHPEATDLYVASLRFEAPGRYWLVVDPEGADVQGIGALDVRPTTISLPLGAKAPPSDNPTLDDASAAEITTARPPDTELLRHSVADSLADRAPFVVVFATPEFCQSRACGPTVEVVQKVAARHEGSGIRFIHVEVFEGNDPENGYNRWMREWSLPTEPWIFLVDGAGTIRAKFEGSAAVDELDDAVREHLRTGP